MMLGDFGSGHARIPFVGRILCPSFAMGLLSSRFVVARMVVGLSYCSQICGNPYKGTES